jgi:hypothetical protein
METILEELGAVPMAQMVRKRLRAGVTSRAAAVAMAREKSGSGS